MNRNKNSRPLRKGWAALLFGIATLLTGTCYGIDPQSSAAPSGGDQSTQTAAQSSPQQAPDPFAGFDEYIEQAIVDWQTPGLAIAVIKDDALIYSRAFGVREVGKPDKVDLDTVFALSSNGKAFTAAAVGLLVDEGRMGWDDPVIKHLPDFRLPDSWVTKNATIRDLQSHRVSGDLGIGVLELWAFTNLSRDDVIHNLRYLKPGPQRFRGLFQYANPNISAVGQTVAALAGMSWDEFMMTRILLPLDMTSATTSVYDLWEEKDVAVCYMCDLDHTPGFEEAAIDNIAMPHIATEDGPRPIPWRTVDNIGPAGSINSNVLDFAKWMRMHLGKGLFEGKRILSEETVAELHAPQMLMRNPAYPIGSGFGSLWAYALGWYVTDYHEIKTVIHTGGITGWRSGIVMLPEKNIGVAVVSNQQSSHLPNTLAPALGFVVFDRLLGLPPGDHSAEWLAATQAGLATARAVEQELLDKRVVGTTPSVAPATLTGTYQHPGFGELVLEFGAAAGTARLAGVMEGTLEHWQDDHYRVTWQGPWPISYFLTFNTGDGGEVASIDLIGFGKFKRAVQ